MTGHEIADAIRALDAGGDFKTEFERLLRELPADDANRMMLLYREGRGSWFPALHVAGGSALWIGNALSGSWVPLANNGFHVTVVDVDQARARFARHRAAAHAPGRVDVIVAGDSRRLPFRDQSFDLVVQEEGVPGKPPSVFGHDLDECRRVARVELVLTAENRLAYKRSTGKRADFKIPGPIEWLRTALNPPAGQETLAGYRRVLGAPGFDAPEAYALYPHARDFTHVVGLDAPLPALPIGPMEQKNKLKLVGQAVGLFPVLTPSFMVSVRRARRAPATTRIERILSSLAEHIGEPVPQPEHWTATRGNSAVILTRPGSSTDPVRGQWALHIPMSVSEAEKLERHARHLSLLRTRFPDFPAPELLFAGEIEDVWLVCERRVHGLGAPQLSGRQDCAANLFDDVVRDYSQLVTQTARPLSEADLDLLIDRKFELVGRYAQHPETLERLETTRLEVRERLLGLSIPRVFYHADLRSKHVRVRPDGHVIGYLDFGSSEESDLPYFDPLHLIVHERKHESDLHAGRAWSIVRDRVGLRDHERAALNRYAETLALPEEYCRAIELAYPVLVAAMAEKNWDYSRPLWLHRQFGF